MPQSNAGSFQFTLPPCYLYLYHTNEYFILPQYPENISDNMSVNFGSQNALARTAPVFSYNNSGPRAVQVNLTLHRDMMNDINTDSSNVQINYGDNIIGNINDDYVDVLIKKLQSIALPRYNSANKAVEPPQIAVCFGSSVFIKGIVDSSVTVNYQLPIIKVTNASGQSTEKYAVAQVNFTVSETQPYDADSVGSLGSFRGLTTELSGGYRFQTITNSKV